MTRPKRGTILGDIASERYRETMLKQYGGAEGVKAHYKEIGKKGGEKSTRGGFYGRPEFARECGRKGGKARSKKYDKIWEDNEGVIMMMYGAGVPLTTISQRFGMSYQTLRSRIKKGLHEGPEMKGE